MSAKKFKSLTGIAVSSLLAMAGAASAACVVPNVISNGTILDAAPVMSDFSSVAACADQTVPAGAQNAIQLNGGSGSFSAVGPLANGQILVGAPSGPPQPTTLTPGTGIVISNGPGSITVSTAGTPSGGGVDWLNGSTVVKPTAGQFSLATSSTSPTGAAIGATSRGVKLTSTATAGDFTAMMAEQNVPAGNWQAIMLSVYTGTVARYVVPGIAVRDTSTSRAVQFGIGGGDGVRRFDYQKTSGGSGFNSYSGDSAVLDPGLPLPNEPIWSRLTFDGSKFTFSFSRDGEFFIPIYSVSATDHLTNKNKIGPVVFFNQPSHQNWATTFHVLSWSIESL